MLSKSAARGFFLVGTGLCSAAFIVLTIDTFQRIPAATRSDELTPEVIKGKDLWEANNCMGCHTIMGEGGYYAPELTKAYERRGPEFLKAMLKDPEAMYPGERRMVNYHFKDDEIDALVAFLRWVGNVDLQGFPPKPTYAPAGTTKAATASTGTSQVNRPAIFNQMCVACHTLGGQGGNVGPSLDKVGDRFDDAYLTKWLHDPGAVKPGAKMPKLPLSDAQITELAAYLSSQKSEVNQ
jgi:nitric oxide reductase subunit C